MRKRLIGLIAALLVVALGATGFFVSRGTAGELRRGIDDDLREDAAAFASQAVPRGAQSPAAVAASVRRYLATQHGFGESARLFVVRVTGGPTITNEPELSGVTHAKLSGVQLGYRTQDLGEAGKVRVLTRPVVRGERAVARLSVGESLASVDRAQDGVVRAFLIAGSITLVAAVVLGSLLASGLLAPLRRMARTAARVDAGDLAPRIRSTGPRDEVRVLADAFDHMLDRLQDAFARQRAFVADASHELRTPLTVIRGQLEVLARDPDPSPEDVRRTERIARAELVRMERLVDDLLLLARADEGALVHPEDVPLRPFVHELFDGVQATANRHFELAGDPGGTLRADPDRVAQATRNLVRNAIEHTRPGGLVRLRVTMTDGAVELAVEDDGPGIPPDQRDRVFDRFHRAEPERREGAGLGLAIVRAIAHAHGGDVGVASSPEGGARVALRVPGWHV